jgi:hypothetical protein
MLMKTYKPEQIVARLRQIEVEMANGKTAIQARKEAEFTIRPSTAGGRDLAD